MNVLFIAGFAVISSTPSQDIRLFVDTLGLPLRPPTSVSNSEYRYSERIGGAKHFGVWPLSEAAHACFGSEEWPVTHPIPQSTIEFEVDDVKAAAAELQGGRSLRAFSRQMVSCWVSAPHPIWWTPDLS